MEKFKIRIVFDVKWNKVNYIENLKPNYFSILLFSCKETCNNTFSFAYILIFKSTKCKGFILLNNFSDFMFIGSSLYKPTIISLSIFHARNFTKKITFLRMV